MSVMGEVHFVGTVAKAGGEEAEMHVFPEFFPGLKEIVSAVPFWPARLLVLVVFRSSCIGSQKVVVRSRYTR